MTESAHTTVPDTRFDDVAGPFGSPEGAWGDLTDQLVDLPARFRGVGRSPQDARVRIVAGPLGSGKSLLLRRMQAYQSSAHEPSLYAPQVQRSSDLRTEDVVNFTKRIGAPVGNSEIWKLLWRRGLFRSVVTYLRADLTDYLPDGASTFFGKHTRLLGSLDRGRRTVVHEVKEIIGSATTGRSYRQKLDDDNWADIENYVANALAEMPPVFFYLDEIDKEFKSAPSAWTLCQKGLMYTIIDLQREVEFQGRLHVVAALRDTTLASVAASEHAQRLLDPTYVNLMNWGREAAAFFLQEKIARLHEHYFADPRNKTVQSFVGFASIRNRRAGTSPEPVADYLIRHTSMVPRDIIRMGNRLCDQIDRLGRESMTEATLREIVASQSAGFAYKLLAVTANQVLSDVLPPAWWRRGRRLETYDLNWARDTVLKCVEGTATEVIDLEKVRLMDAAATELFVEYSEGSDVRLSDILWQNRLLCAVYESGEARYFNLDEGGSMVALPRVGGVVKYVWNPILFDVTTRLELQLQFPHWPR